MNKIFTVILSNPVKYKKVREILDTIEKQGIEAIPKIKARKLFYNKDNQYLFIIDGCHRYTALINAIGNSVYKHIEIVEEIKKINFQQLMYLRLLENIQATILKNTIEDEKYNKIEFYDIAKFETIKEKLGIKKIDIDNPIEEYEFINLYLCSDQTEGSAEYIKGIIRIIENNITIQGTYEGEFCNIYNYSKFHKCCHNYKLINIKKEIQVDNKNVTDNFIIYHKCKIKPIDLSPFFNYSNEHYHQITYSNIIDDFLTFEGAKINLSISPYAPYIFVDDEDWFFPF